MRGLETALDGARPVVVKGGGVEGHAQHFRLGQGDLHGGQARVIVGQVDHRPRVGQPDKARLREHHSAGEHAPLPVACLARCAEVGVGDAAADAFIQQYDLFSLELFAQLLRQPARAKETEHPGLAHRLMPPFRTHH